MTNRRYVLRSTNHSLHESEEKLLKDQGLIILLEATKYIQRNNTDRIRYSHLKQLSNDKLAYLTRNHETDFGGKFENYIIKFESKLEPSKRLLTRDKIRRKESYIIPNVEKIEKLFVRYNISNLLDEELVPYKIKGPIVEIKYPKEKEFITLERGIMLSDGIPHTLYSICYYYENGDPVFVPGFEGNMYEKDPMPFYEDKSRYRSISFE
jgi:hypothetical protein